MIPVALRPPYFGYLLLLAKRPKAGYMLNVGKESVLILP